MKFKLIKLNEDEIKALETGYKTGNSHRFRQRCQIILLNQKKQVSEIASILTLSTYSVYKWLSRYEAEGIEGLQTKKEQGRKSIIKSEDYDLIKQAVQKERQKLKVVHEELQNTLGKKFSQKTLKRILKNLAVDTNE